MDETAMLKKTPPVKFSPAFFKKATSGSVRMAGNSEQELAPRLKPAAALVAAGFLGTARGGGAEGQRPVEFCRSAGNSQLVSLPYPFWQAGLFVIFINRPAKLELCGNPFHPDIFHSGQDTFQHKIHRFTADFTAGLGNAGKRGTENLI